MIKPIQSFDPYLIFSLNPFFISSFSEGNQRSILNVTASSEIQGLDASNLLTSKVIGDGKITYVLASSDFSGLKVIEKSLQSNQTVETIQLNR